MPFLCGFEMTIPTAVNVGTQDRSDPTTKWLTFRGMQRVAEYTLNDTKTKLQSGQRFLTVVFPLVMALSDLLVSMLAIQEDVQCRLIAKREFNNDNYDVAVEWPSAVAAIRDSLEWFVSNWPHTNENIFMQRWDVTRDGSNNLTKVSVASSTLTLAQSNTVVSKIDSILMQFV